MTEPERLVWLYLKSKQLGSKFRRQYGIGPYIVDFYSREARLAVEIDGDSHYFESAEAYDIQRDAFISSFGIRVIRFTNGEVMRNVSAVIRRIQENLP